MFLIPACCHLMIYTKHIPLLTFYLLRCFPWKFLCFTSLTMWMPTASKESRSKALDNDPQQKESFLSWTNNTFKYIFGKQRKPQLRETWKIIEGRRFRKKLAIKSEISWLQKPKFVDLWFLTQFCNLLIFCILWWNDFHNKNIPFL